MARKGKEKKGNAARPGSLLSREATGGLIAGGGLDFQVRYAVCHLPLWLQQDLFQQLLFEGTGDVDLRFKDASGSSSRKHIQIKDHEVSPAELKSAIQLFQRTDAGMHGIYQSFTLACPSLSPTIRPVEAALSRFRGAKPFYDDVPQALAATLEDLSERLSGAGLHDCAEFIQNKVFIEVGHGDLRHDERAAELFVSRVLEHPGYAKNRRSAVAPAFSELLRVVSARRGVVMDRGELERTLQAAVHDYDAETPGITLWIHNWTAESFDRPANYVLDWSSHFDRAVRRVPSADTWNDSLLPQLRSLQRQIASERKERLIYFRGKCALSTGLALGATFPIVGGWIFAVAQPPSREDWRSDVEPTAGYAVETEIVEGAAGATDLILALNLKGDGRGDVKEYVERSAIQAKLYAFVAPPALGARAIGGSHDASAFAFRVRDTLGELLKGHRPARTHVFFYGPLALSIFVGQQLTSVGEVRAYEYQDPGYTPSWTLRT